MKEKYMDIRVMRIYSKLIFTVLTLFLIQSLSLFCAYKTLALETDYIIGPQDELMIEVWDNTDLTRQVSVSLSGYFNFPLIGEVYADGLTVEDLQKKITERLADGYLKNPQVTVTVSAYRSKQISIIGEVKKPGTYPYTRNTSIIEIISMAGGLTNEAGSEAYIIHPEEIESFKISENNLLSPQRRTPEAGSKSNNKDNIEIINLKDMLESGQNIYLLLRKNDTIYIPRADFFYILGEVKNPGQYKIEENTTVLKAISTAGGYTVKANLKKIIIVRVINEKEKELNGHLSDLVLPNDIIKIPESFF